MVAPVRVASPTSSGEAHAPDFVDMITSAEAAAARPDAPMATAPSFNQRWQGRVASLTPLATPADVGVATRGAVPRAFMVGEVAKPGTLLHPELTSSVVNRFLGTARHTVTASSERTLTSKEEEVLHLLLGTRARLDPKTVPPNRTDQMLLQRLLNMALGERLSPPIEVDGSLGGRSRAALDLYRRERHLKPLPGGALIDRATLEQLAREASASAAQPNKRVPPAAPDATPAVRSATAMLDVLSREDPVRYSATLRAVGVSNVKGPLTAADIDKVIAAGTKDGRRLVFDDSTATRLQLAQPENAGNLPWNHDAARIVSMFLTEELTPNRSAARLADYRAWARRADFAGQVSERYMEIDALVESEYTPRLVSSAQARGLHQLTKDVTDRWGHGDPFNPVANISMARRELPRVYDDQLRRMRAIDETYAARYPDEASMPHAAADRNDPLLWKFTYAANNAGPRRLIRYQGVPPFVETQRHVAFMGWYNATLPTTAEVPPRDPPQTLTTEQRRPVHKRRPLRHHGHRVRKEL